MATQLLQGILTKKFLMTLDEGNYMMSNLSDEYSCPIFEGKVSPRNLRGMQWEKIKQVGAQGRTCRIFKTKSDYVRWMDSAVDNRQRKE